MMENSQKERHQIGYWLVEANWDENNSQLERFKSEGIWVNGFDDKAGTVNEIKPNDFIAIKTSYTKKVGEGRFISGLRIQAIGIVTRNLRDGKLLEVRWNLKETSNEIDNMAKTGPIHRLSDMNEIRTVFFSRDQYVYYRPKTEQKEQQQTEEEDNSDSGNILQDLAYSIAVKSKVKDEPDEEIIPEEKDNFTVKYPLNLIYYGPTGSGKTYKTISTALEIIDGFFPENHKEAKKRFDEYVARKQISFVTFHPSYTYEDFVEGMKPIVTEEASGKVDYRIKEGVFKETVNLAKAELVQPKKVPFDPIKKKSNFYKLSIGKLTGEKDDTTFSFCLNNNCIALDMLGGIDYSIIENTKDWEQAKEELNKVYFTEENEVVKRQNIQTIYFFKNFMKPDDIVFISNNNKTVIAIGRVAGYYEFRDLPGINYHHFRKVDWIVKDCSIPVEKFYRKDFSDLPIYPLNKKNMLLKNMVNYISSNYQRNKNYVMIIDEINRGNVRNIFGELFTLLDPSKRLGNEEALTVKLTLSNEDFGVPKNLYVIGTMNSSLSSEIFDETLRRRFDFIELNIDYKLIKFKIDGIEIDKLLEAINKRLIYLLGKEFQIGHGFFSELKEKPSFENLRNIFRYKLIPLLQSYFNNDLEQVSLVLGDNQKKGTKNKFIQTDSLNSEELFGKKVKQVNIRKNYKVILSDNPEAYIQIYKKQVQEKET